MKICGITSIEDALYAVVCGADALGFNFYEKSPRQVAPELVSEVRKALPPFITLVGLMVNPSRQQAADVMAKASPDLFQFHGEETNEFCRSWGIPFIKAVRVGANSANTNNSAILDEINRYPDATGILLDTYVADKVGGTGQRFDWSTVPEKCDKPVILAGGLNPGNVKAAIETVKPYAVDVSSGVESDPGIKDRDKVKRFINAVSSR